jgi:hypothetical protein
LRRGLPFLDLRLIALLALLGLLGLLGIWHKRPHTIEPVLTLGAVAGLPFEVPGWCCVDRQRDQIAKASHFVTPAHLAIKAHGLFGSLEQTLVVSKVYAHD